MSDGRRLSTSRFNIGMESDRGRVDHDVGFPRNFVSAPLNGEFGLSLGLAVEQINKGAARLSPRFTTEMRVTSANASSTPIARAAPPGPSRTCANPQWPTIDRAGQACSLPTQNHLADALADARLSVNRGVLERDINATELAASIG
jgi:hypothetical protein